MNFQHMHTEQKPLTWRNGLSDLQIRKCLLFNGSIHYLIIIHCRPSAWSSSNVYLFLLLISIGNKHKKLVCLHMKQFPPLSFGLAGWRFSMSLCDTFHLAHFKCQYDHFLPHTKTLAHLIIKCWLLSILLLWMVGFWYGLMSRHKVRFFPCIFFSTVIYSSHNCHRRRRRHRKGCQLP